MKSFKSDFENLVEDVDQYFASQGAPAGRMLDKFGGQELIEIEALAKWKSGAASRSKRTETFSIFDWKLENEDTLKGTPLFGRFIYSKSKIDKDELYTGSVDVLKMVGYLSKEEDMFLIQSLEIHDVEGHETLEKRAAELFAPQSYSSRRFGELTYDATRSEYSGQYSIEGRCISVTFKSKPDEMEVQDQKMAKFFDQLDRTTDWLRGQKKVSKHVGDDGVITLSRVSLDHNLVWATFRFPGNHDIQFVHVVTFYEEGEFTKTVIDSIER